MAVRESVRRVLDVSCCLPLRRPPYPDRLRPSRFSTRGRAFVPVGPACRWDSPPLCHSSEVFRETLRHFVLRPRGLDLETRVSSDRRSLPVVFGGSGLTRQRTLGRRLPLRAHSPRPSTVVPRFLFGVLPETLPFRKQSSIPGDVDWGPLPLFRRVV